MSNKVVTLVDVARSPGAAALRALRLELGLSQEAAGSLRRMNARQVRKYENNESPMEALELYIELLALVMQRRASANDNRKAA